MHRSAGQSGRGRVDYARFLDGDEFRSLFGNDLKYTIKDRDKNAQRMTAFVKYLSNQKINLVISANITSLLLDGAEIFG